jgi:AraC family transcriptional regulator of arabinose operon
MPESKSFYFTTEPRDMALPLLVASVGINLPQNKIVRNNGYDDFHFFLCTGGEGAVEAGGRSFALRENMAMILFPNEPHLYYPTREPWLVSWITFNGGSASRILEYLEIRNSVAFELPYPEIAASAVREFGEIINTLTPTQKIDVSCQLYKLLAGLYWNMPAGKNTSQERRYKTIEPAIHYIEANLNRLITLEMLADAAGVSTKYLCLLFQEVLHVRPFRYINTCRINKCKQLLLEDRTMSIYDISTRCGYENICYFNQTFRGIVGMSPSQFRQLH